MLGATLNATAYLERLNAEIEHIDQAAMNRWADLIYQAWENERWVYIFGNGGSGTTASHMSEDLGKSTLREKDLHDESRKRLKVLSLTDNAGRGRTERTTAATRSGARVPDRRSSAVAVSSRESGASKMNPGAASS